MDTTAAERFLAGLRPAFEAGDPGAADKAAEAACVRLVEEQYRAVARGDFAAFLAMLSEDVELENVGPPGVPFVGRWRGRSEVVAALGRNFACLEDQRPEVLAVVAQGDTVVVSGRERGRYRPTGREYDVHWVQFFTFADGRLVRFRQVLDGTSLAEAAAD